MPILIMVICYALIFINLKKHSKYFNNITSYKTIENKKQSLSVEAVSICTKLHTKLHAFPLEMYFGKYSSSKPHFSFVTKTPINNPYRKRLVKKRPISRVGAIKRKNKQTLEKNLHIRTMKMQYNDSLSKLCVKTKIIFTEWQLTKNAIFIITAFCLSWLPYGIISLIGQFSCHPEMYVTPKTTLIPVLMAKFSTILNPIIYIFSNKRFMRKAKNFFLNICSKRN